MDGLWKAFNELMETLNKYNDISLQIEEQNRFLTETGKRLEKIVEAVCTK